MTMELQPEIIVTAASLPQLNGIDAMRILQKEVQSAKVLFLAARHDLLLVREAFRAGAKGYLLKSCCFGELLTAIRLLVRGDIYIPPVLSDELLPFITVENS